MQSNYLLCPARFAALAALAFALAACGPEAPAELAETSDELYYDGDRLWPSGDIEVCWTAGGFATEKAWVREVMTGQRSWAAEADLDFVGWGRCSCSAANCNPADRIEITPGDSMAVAGGLGRRPVYTEVVDKLGRRRVVLHYYRSQMELDFTAGAQNRWARCDGLNRRECVQAVALHEFGHALGYAHEHNRPDDVACAAANQGSNGDQTYGPYDGSSIMNYCGGATDLSPIDRKGTKRLYGVKNGPSQKLGDYDGDGRADILCYDPIDGEKAIGYATSSGGYDGDDWNTTTNWCTHEGAVVYTGDFDGDGQTDLLCHDHNTGYHWIDYASSRGRFAGTNWQYGASWCTGRDRLLVGDFDGDGRDDLFCQDDASRRRSIDYASSSGRFTGANWVAATLSWCRHDAGRLYVGDFDGDGREDLLCFDIDDGRKWIDYADTQGRFHGTDWSQSASSWCSWDTSELHVGDFDGDGRDDLLCHTLTTGYKRIDYADVHGRFRTSSGRANWERANAWCRHNEARLLVGDANGDGRDDMVCHDVATGYKWVDLANGQGRFYGTNSTASGLCGDDGVLIR